MTAPKHPATFSKDILKHLVALVEKYQIKSCLDPMGGVGKIHHLDITTHAVEIEVPWAAQSSLRGTTTCGDFLEIAKAWIDLGIKFQAIITSPTYANRMAEFFNATKTTQRNTYGFALGRRPVEGSSASMRWGDEYRGFHQFAWMRAVALLEDEGYFILNIKNHIKDFEEIEVMQWHRKVLLKLGLQLVESIEVGTRGLAYGANYDSRTECEYLLVFQKGKAA